MQMQSRRDQGEGRDLDRGVLGERRAAVKRVDSGIGRDLDAAPPGPGHSPPGRRKRRFMRLIGVKSNRWQMRLEMGLPGSSARKRCPSLPACRGLEDGSRPGAAGCPRPPRPGQTLRHEDLHGDSTHCVTRTSTVTTATMWQCGLMESTPIILNMSITISAITMSIILAISIMSGNIGNICIMQHQLSVPDSPQKNIKH